jgi:hypothetical protein
MSSIMNLPRYLRRMPLFCRPIMSMEQAKKMLTNHSQAVTELQKLREKKK